MSKKKDYLVPYCRHGPAKLFERQTMKKTKRFYACSAARTRKDCSLYVLEEEAAAWIAKRGIYSATKISHALQHGNESKFESTDIINTSSMKAHTDNKTQAQYFFSEESITYMLCVIQTLGINRIICIGCPRLFEKAKSIGIQSFLLDIDERFSTLPVDSFAVFNMFNCTFLSETGQSSFKNFLELCDHNSAIFVDPPFGGLISPLFDTLKTLLSDYYRLVKIFICQMCYMEAKIIAADEAMKMADFMITYENHKSFKSSSPVRFFTNVSLNRLPLPNPKQYRLCEECKCFRLLSNLHCSICATCPSKDGKPFKHCEDCKRCVKISYTHCSKCLTCHLPGRCEDARFNSRKRRRI